MMRILTFYKIDPSQLNYRHTPLKLLRYAYKHITMYIVGESFAMPNYSARALYYFHHKLPARCRLHTSTTRLYCHCIG